jgi:hypothetical protein
MAAKKKLTAEQKRKRIAGLEKTLRTGKKSDGTKLSAKGRLACQRLVAGLKASLAGKKPAKKTAKKPAKKAAKRAAKRSAKKPAKKTAKKAAKRSAKKPAKRGAKKSAKRKPLQTRKGGIASFERAVIGRVANGPLPSAIKIEEIYTRPRKKTTRRKPARKGRR